MAKMIQGRNVPDTLHRVLKAWAAMNGMSLSDYLLSEMREIAERPTWAELRERLKQVVCGSRETCSIDLADKESGGWFCAQLCGKAKFVLSERIRTWPDQGPYVLKTGAQMQQYGRQQTKRNKGIRSFLYEPISSSPPWSSSIDGVVEHDRSLLGCCVYGSTISSCQSRSPAYRALSLSRHQPPESSHANGVHG